ncbi:MAG: AAA family ATPase [Acholeplasmatales bacterium]|jgi:predicted AAA+ superfamily ATPase|nr:AAA family ATPase [Acholeplasmatales bacterium]
MDILRYIIKYNHWWNAGEINKNMTQDIKRSEFEQIMDLLDSKRITMLVGPRRCGMTTLLYQSIDELLKRGVKPSNIIFFDGDDALIFDSHITIGDIFSIYERDILGNNVEDINEKVYIVVDNISFLKDWSLYLKNYLKEYPNIKFIMSSSIASNIFKIAKEELISKMDIINIFPLKTNQFVDSHLFFNADSMNFTSLLPKVSLFEDPKQYFESLREKMPNLLFYENKINNIVNKYLLAGGYPEFRETSKIDLWQKRTNQDIISHGFFRDIMSLYSIKNPYKLVELFYYLAKNDGNTFSYNSIGQELKLDNETVLEYITFLRKAGYLIIETVYSKHSYFEYKSPKRILFLDNGIRNSIVRETSMNIDLKKKCARTSLNFLAFMSCLDNNWNLFYESKNNHNIVIDKINSNLVIKPKFTNNVTPDDFSKIDDNTINIVVTSSLLDYKDNTYYIPFWLVN